MKMTTVLNQQIRRPIIFSLLCAVMMVPQTLKGLNIQLDYSYDAANGNFFGSNPTAKAAVDAAALDLGNAITGSLSAVTTDVFTGTNGSTSATFNWKLTFADPSTGSTVTLNTFSFLANSLTIYVGMKLLSGSTLGVGGPAGAGFTLNGSGFSNEWIGAVGAAESASNSAMRRIGGPIVGTLSDSSTFGANTANYSLQYGTMVGKLSFDSDSNNDGSTDNSTDLANYWHYDRTTPVAPGKNDLYSVALHEILHSIGFGVSDTWSSLHSGTTWTGANVIALTGTGANMVSSDGGHAADGLMSLRLSDGAVQEAVMDPSITVGTRKSLTEVDLAFLRDLGYTTIPEPCGSVLLIGAGLVFSTQRRRTRA
jgi:hypothetical protein